ncbi:MAG: glycine--tRNA ligase subunit beta [Proteobacteria bacterium]|nr:glycine--tRNA ligase subunit beta [Pseudomonadota bacterium]NOG60989.1 glycine--tRNA ligase subunit beta [Pseudomonadota bacterium]
MSNTQNLLIEIGTEELPPKSLKKLASAFKDEMIKSFNEEKLNFSDANWYATPRRLSLIINNLEVKQEDKQQQRRGPALAAAYDAEGKPTKATEGFAKSCGVSVDQLEKLETDKGTWLAFNAVIKGKETTELISAIIETALGRLPIAKRMRWGDSDVEFVRPVKWVLILFGTDYLDCEIMGITSGKESFGHRFHHPHAVSINAPENYIETLKKEAHVLVDYNERRTLIESQVNAIAEENNGIAIIDPDLLDEVTALVEWPVSFVGEFNSDFLKLPKEVLISSMQDHQKYFPVVDTKGNLLPYFISVANIESKNPALVKRGNERVIQPRLNDAAFFWERDLKHGLANHIESLKKVIYQKQLGTLFDKSDRLQKSVLHLAKPLNIEIDQAKRAAALCLCDLLTDMVSEFPALQGTMGRYYAEADGEDGQVAIALEEYYQPRFAGDALPTSALGQCLAISEKIDSLVGIFAIGKAPTGDKDPFGLRRSAIGLLRIIIECNLDIDLKELITNAAANYPTDINSNNCIDDVYHFLMERLRRYYLDEGVSPDTFESVLAINTSKPLDFHHRLTAVTEFRKLTQAESLAAANKRISNILKKSEITDIKQVNDNLLTEESEITLAKSLNEYQKRLAPMIEKRDYKSALTELAGLRENVDNFFDNVMVNCEDDATRINRLALLNSLSALFLKTADISKLQS